VAWAEAAKCLAKYPDVVVTACDVDGYPISVRQATSAYDAVTGEMPVPLAEALRPAPGPAGLLCHSHNEKLWNQTTLTVKGRLERREDNWVFVGTAFTPPSLLAIPQMIKRARASTNRYIANRKLEAPQINWAAIAEAWRRVKQ